MDDKRKISKAPKRTDDDMATVTRGRPRPLDGGRLSVYATLGALTGLVPLPWVPGSLAKRVRGALVQDIAARHGLSLSTEARTVLARSGGSAGTTGMALQAVRYVGLKLIPRLAPLGFLAPVQSALTIWALGHLFDRYVESCRTERAVRIDTVEAERVREAIDRAIMHAFTAAGREENVETSPEELRDTVKQVVDGMLTAAAALPSWLVRRLDAAFDELVPHAQG